MKTLSQQKEALEAAGYRVILDPVLLERETLLGPDDDWIFADKPGAMLIAIGKDGFWIEVEKEGEADVAFEEVDLDGRLLKEGMSCRFRNAFVPDAFRRVIDDQEIVEVEGTRYLCTVRYNGWFTPFMGHKDDEAVADHGDPQHDLGTLSCWSDMLEAYIKERKAEAA